jgi:O-antigen/teichoic acid export membrane protein
MLLRMPWRRISGFLAPYMGSFGVSAGRVANLGLGVGTSVLIARILGPAQRGEFAAASAISAIGLQVCGLGLHASLPYFVSTNRPAARPLLRRALGILLGASAAWLVGTLVWRSLGTAEWLTTMPIALVVVACLAVPASGLLAFTQGAALGADRMRAFGWSDASARCVAAALILMMLAAGVNDPGSRTVALMACSVAASVVTGLVLWRGLPRMDGPSVLPRLRTELGYAWRSAVACLLSTIPVRWISVHLLEAGSREQAGQFAVALMVVEAVVSVGAAFAGSRLTDMVRLHTGPNGLKREAFRSAGFLAAAGVAGVMMVQFAVVPILGLVFGSAFVPAGPALTAMLAGMAFMPIATVFQIAMAAGGMPTLCVAGPGCAVLVTWLAVAGWWPMRTADAAGWMFSIQALVFLLASMLAFLVHEAIRARAMHDRPQPIEAPDAGGSVVPADREQR